jgi:hypothetical protein
MKILSPVSNPATLVASSTTTENPVSLHQLVSQLMDSFIPLAVVKRSFIVNDVDPAFQLMADEQVLAFVIGNLLNGAISGTKNVCIRVEAVRKADGVQICVRNNANNFYSTIADGFSQVLDAAYRLGGNIHIYNQRNEGMVITLSLAA